MVQSRNLVKEKRIALRLAEKMGLEARRRNGLRVNLFELAQQVGIDRIEEKDIPIPAMLIGRPDGVHYTAFLKKGTPTPRQRFSLAHEIAHVLLKPLLEGEVQHWARLDPSQDPHGQKIERLCDQMASIILMPEELFGRWLADREWTAFALPKALQEFSVSFEAAALRFILLFPRPVALARWQLHRNGEPELSDKLITKGIPKAPWLSILPKPNVGLPSIVRVFKTGQPTRTSEAVHFGLRNSGRVENCCIESLRIGNGDFQKVYSFIYPQHDQLKPQMTSSSQ